MYILYLIKLVTTKSKLGINLNSPKNTYCSSGDDDNRENIQGTGSLRSSSGEKSGGSILV